MSYETTSRRRRAAGMTLIELMIVTAIVAILAAIAYPSYQGHIAKTHRKAAAACLSQYANFMERYYTTHLTYEGAAPDLACKTENDLSRFYSIPAPAIDDARSYTLTADPTDAQNSRDPNRCGPLTLNESGARTPAGDKCW